MTITEGLSAFLGVGFCWLLLGIWPGRGYSAQVMLASEGHSLQPCLTQSQLLFPTSFVFSEELPASPAHCNACPLFEADSLTFSVFAGNFIATAPTLQPLHSFPFSMKGDLIIIQATLGGIFQVNLILDTGAEYNLFFKKYLFDLLSVTYGRSLTVRGADRIAEMMAHRSAPVELSMGRQPLRTDFLVLDEMYFDLESALGTSVDGVLGFNFLQNYLVEVNHQKKRIHLHPKAQKDWNPGPHFTEIPLERERNKMFAALTLQHKEEAPTHVELLLDSGAAMSLLLFSETDSLLAKESFQLQPSIIGLGLGGYLNGFEGAISTLQWGPFELGSTRFYLQETDTLYMDHEINRRNGILGNRILSLFHYFLDLDNNRIFLKPSKNFSKGPKKDLTGLLILSRGLYFNQYFVGHVYAGSPAEGAGFQSGDRILSINGIPSRWYKLERLHKIFRKKSNRKLNIKIERNQTKRILRLQRKDYLEN
jgi:hypothetical protein